MKLDIQKPLRRMPVVVLPMYGVVQYTTLVRREPRVSLYVIELPRKALGLPCDELLALLASDPLQEFVGRWRINPVGTPKQDEFESLLRCEMNGLQQAMFRRRQRLLDWEQHRVLVHRCAADAIACMDRRSLRGKAVKLAGESPDGMPAAVQVIVERIGENCEPSLCSVIRPLGVCRVAVRSAGPVSTAMPVRPMAA